MPHILDNEILPTGYAIFRNDHHSRGGGVMIAVKSNIPSKLLDKQNSLETLLVSVSYDKRISLFV